MVLYKGVNVKSYLDLVTQAVNNVNNSYFKLLTTYNQRGIVRERMFCYELYHQMRCLGVTSNDKILHGEIDKRGHCDFLKDDRLNPDFVLHQPGSFDQNSLVIEVKGKLGRIDGLRKDFKTLLKFTGDYKYKTGIFVIYNHDFDELKQKVREDFITEGLKSSSELKHIYVLARKCPNSLCTQHKMSDLFDL